MLPAAMVTTTTTTETTEVMTTYSSGNVKVSGLGVTDVYSNESRYYNNIRLMHFKHRYGIVEQNLIDEEKSGNDKIHKNMDTCMSGKRHTKDRMIRNLTLTVFGQCRVSCYWRHFSVRRTRRGVVCFCQNVKRVM